MKPATSQVRLHKWMISGPPLAYLLVFFAIPVLIMVVASFRHPGDFGGLAPLLYSDDTGAHLGLTAEYYGRLLSDFLYTQLFIKSFAYAAITTLVRLLIPYPLAMLSARS